MRALGGDIREFDASPADAVVGARVRDLHLPESALVMLVVRDGQGIPPRGRTTIESGDRLYVLARADDRERVEALLERWEAGFVASTEAGER